MAPARRHDDRMPGLDLFSGIGGISLALQQWVRPVAYCDVDPFCREVLASRMRDGRLDAAPIWDDVTKLTGAMLPERPSIIYGGFPCQDISCAGAGKGLEGERSGLFFEIVRLARETGAEWIFCENVPALRTRGAERVVKELASIGYDCRWDTLAALDVGAPHVRIRWFLLAHRPSDTADADSGGVRDGRQRQQEGQAAPGRVTSDDGGARPLAATVLRRILAARTAALAYAARERRGEGRPEPKLRSGGHASADCGDEGRDRSDCAAAAGDALADAGRIGCDAQVGVLCAGQPDAAGSGETGSRRDAADVGPQGGARGATALADADCGRLDAWHVDAPQERAQSSGRCAHAGGSGSGEATLADTDDEGRDERPGSCGERGGSSEPADGRAGAGDVPDADLARSSQRLDADLDGPGQVSAADRARLPGPSADGAARAEPRVRDVADGLPARVDDAGCGVTGAARGGEEGPAVFAPDFWDRERDGVPRVIAGRPWRVEQVHALGNAVVPAQVREAFMRLVGLNDSSGLPADPLPQF